MHFNFTVRKFRESKRFSKWHTQTQSLYCLEIRSHPRRNSNIFGPSSRIQHEPSVCGWFFLGIFLHWSFSITICSLSRWPLSTLGACSLTPRRKRRGSRLTRLSTRLKDLEGEAGEPKTLELAQRMSQKLSDLDLEFRTYHHSLIDLIDDEEALAKEQEVLDTHDDSG